MLLTLVIFALSILDALAKSEFENLVIVKSFADSLLAPVSGVIASKGNSSLFAPDVKGSLDIFGDMDGQELATEYTFGLFSRASVNPSVPSILGEPVGYNVTSLAVEHSYVTANIVVNLSYPVISTVVPLELGLWAMINPAGQISQFDVSFRRWGWFIQTVTSQLLPGMASWAGISSNDTDIIMRGYWSKVICGTDLLTCDSSTFGGMSSCQSYISTVPLGDLTQIGDDSLACRGFQAALALLRPGYYCGSSGAMGPNSTVCVARAYSSIVGENHFPHGWIAPKPTSPEGQAMYGDYEITNGVSLLPQLEFSLQDDSMTSFSISLFSTCTFALWLILWANAKLLTFAYRRWSRKFRNLPIEIQRTNVVMLMNIFWTLVALGLELAGVACYWNDYHGYQMICVRTTGVVICALYSFELVFRWDMRLPLVAHHFLTIFCICWAIALFEQTGNVSFMATGVTWLFQATTEQPTFVALYLYRMSPPSIRVSYLLKGAAIQTLLFKCASAAGVIAIWAIHQRETLRALDVAWSASMFVVAVGLMLTQVWGSWVTWKIGVRVAKQCRESRRQADLEALRYCQRAEESKFSIDKLELPAELAEARLANTRPLAYHPRQQRHSLPRDVSSDSGSVNEKGVEKRDSGVLEPFCSPSLLYRYGRLPLSSPGATPAVRLGTYDNLGEVWSPPTPPGSWESQSDTRSETPLEIDDSVIGLIDFSRRRESGEGAQK